MDIRDYFRLFTEEELVRGAELYFSGDLNRNDGKSRDYGKIAPGRAQDKTKILNRIPEKDSPLNGRIRGFRERVRPVPVLCDCINRQIWFLKQTAAVTAIKRTAMVAPMWQAFLQLTQ